MTSFNAMFASETRVGPVNFGAVGRGTTSWRPGASRVDAPAVVVADDDGALREAERVAAHAAELADAFDRGQADGLASRAAEVASLRSSLSDAIAAIDGHVAALADASRSEAVTLAVAIARAVIGAELRTNPDALRGVVERAMAAVPRTDEVVLRCHPADQEAMAALVPEVTRHRGEAVSVRVAASRDVERGGCVLDFEEGSVDAQPSVALDVVVAAIQDMLGGDA